jgi:ribonuclease BN (tRNA processing enzyme)
MAGDLQTFLRWGAGVVVALVIAALAPSEAAAAEASSTRLVILGSGAGRTSWHGYPSGGFSAAVATGGQVYIVDFGRNWLDRFFEAGLGAPGAVENPGGMETIRAAFITHLHADHVVDLPRLLLFGATDGLRRRKTPMRIYGPGSRGAVAETSAKLQQSAALVSPEAPSSGTTAMVENLYKAFAADLNDNIRDSGMPNPHEYIVTHDIEIPAAAGASPANYSPPMEPFEVYRDENVRVTAVLVSHAPMFPAFGFRFDTKDGSIAFSGDTGPDENVIRLAKGADILVHEAMDIRWVEARAKPPLTPDQEAKIRHLKNRTPTCAISERSRRAPA